MFRLPILLCVLAIAATGCPPVDPPAEPMTVTVDGAEALIDLGEVGLRSAHLVVFRVANPSHQPLMIDSVRSDCDCVEVIDPPQHLPPNAVTDVHVRFQAPNVALSYQTEVILVTDRADRPVIRLQVKCVTKR
ncbi:MAG: DUF1573 domain-containing protein [Planctomycetota bacterium]|jgi:hypothetical protein